MPTLLLITHEHIGKDMLRTAAAIVDRSLADIRCFEVPLDADTAEVIERAERDLGDSEALILTDLYGSTPGNVAAQLAQSGTRHLVSGLNLPMLLRAINYQNLPLEELTDKATEGGKSGIIHD